MGKLRKKEDWEIIAEIKHLDNRNRAVFPPQVADILKGKGATKVTTSNAEKYTYVKTLIRAKKEFVSSIDEIEILLKSKYALEKTETLDSSASADIQIIVGK